MRGHPKFSTPVTSRDKDKIRIAAQLYGVDVGVFMRVAVMSEVDRALSSQSQSTIDPFPEPDRRTA